MKMKTEIYYELLRPEGTVGSMHNHPMYEIVYYETGIGHTTIAGKRYRYTPGTLAFIPPETMHDEVCDKDSQIQILNFQCTGMVPQELAAGLYADRDGSVSRCIRKIRDEYNYILPLMDTFVDLFCQELYYTILRGNNVNSNLSSTLNFVINYMNQCFSEELSVTQLAQMCGYSERHFRQIFKTKTGFSPTEYILKRRLDNAKGLLNFTDDSIISIASKCGFCSSSQFAQLFRKEVGVSPKEFRRQNKG